MLACDNGIMLCCYKSSYWFEINPEVFTDETIPCLEFDLKRSGKNEQTTKWSRWAGGLDEPAVWRSGDADNG